MPREPVPQALAEKLGEDATDALSVMLGSARAECTEDVLTLSTERFERRLSEECSRLRVDVAGEIAKFRVEMSGELSKLRAEVASGMSIVRTDLVREISGVRQEVATTRVDLFKWSFVFWIGQVAAVGGLLAVMLRSAG